VLAGCILEPTRIWQLLGAASYHPGTSQDMAATTARRHHKHKSKITFIDKEDHIKFQVTHQGLFGWSNEKTA
jgi:hypothetical protein